jgi:hypothetical protein
MTRSLVEFDSTAGQEQEGPGHYSVESMLPGALPTSRSVVHPRFVAAEQPYLV